MNTLSSVSSLPPALGGAPTQKVEREGVPCGPRRAARGREQEQTEPGPEGQVEDTR